MPGMRRVVYKSRARSRVESARVLIEMGISEIQLMPVKRGVLAERSPPNVRDAYEDEFYAFTGDRFVSTYLRGPLGVIARTDGQV